MRLPRFSKKLLAIGAVVGISLGTGGIAAAYFSASGTGNGHAPVGTPTAFTVTAGTATGTLYPDTSPYTTATATIVYTVKNTSIAKEHYTIPANSAAIVESTVSTHTTTIAGPTTTAGKPKLTTDVTGCTASWFGATNAAKSGTLAKTATTTVTVTVHMTNAAATQNSCATHTPYVKLSFSS